MWKWLKTLFEPTIEHGPWFKAKKCHCGKVLMPLNHFDGLCPSCGCGDRIETKVVRFTRRGFREWFEEWPGCSEPKKPHSPQA